MIRVVVADDQALVRAGFRMILQAQPDIEVVGGAEGGAQAITITRELDPDVVLMDIKMPGVDGLEATQRLLAGRQPRPCVLMLTTFDTDEYVYRALRAGAGGFLLKTAPPARLLEAVRTIAAGEALLAPTVTRKLIESFVRRPPPGSAIPPELAALTEREVQVLTMAARGLSNLQIAQSLFLSEADRQIPHQPAIRQTGHTRPGPGRRPGLRNRPRHARRRSRHATHLATGRQSRH